MRKQITPPFCSEHFLIKLAWIPAAEPPGKETHIREGVAILWELVQSNTYLEFLNKNMKKHKSYLGWFTLGLGLQYVFKRTAFGIGPTKTDQNHLARLLRRNSRTTALSGGEPYMTWAFGMCPRDVGDIGKSYVIDRNR